LRVMRNNIELCSKMYTDSLRPYIILRVARMI